MAVVLRCCCGDGGDVACACAHFIDIGIGVVVMLGYGVVVLVTAKLMAWLGT